ncbi:MAG: hypothetical protein JSV65_18780, partial [Armatimonadota bacterium]
MDTAPARSACRTRSAGALRWGIAGVAACAVLAMALTSRPAAAAKSYDDELAARRQQLIEQYATGPAHEAYVELTRLATNRAPNEGAIGAELNQMDKRWDCADFGLHAILRLLYWHAESPRVSPELLARARQSVLDFKYWPDEPGVDSMCTWSENHHILFSAGGYLAGQLYPDAIFTNSGRTGTEMMAAHRPRVMRWLDLRYRTGFSEWFSNVYYDEDLAALLSLADLCADEEIALRAAMVTDLLLLDIALNSYRGVFGSTHGRSYENHKKWADRESTTNAAWLLFGMGTLGSSSMSATCLALSPHYRMPQVIYEIANDVKRPETINRQRIGIKLEEAERWGLGFSNFEDGMVWLSLEAYAHPLMIELFVDMLDAFNWWENSFFAPFAAQRQVLEQARAAGMLPQLARMYEHDVCRNLRDEVNVYTYKTPEYMLSSAQDYRVGYGGDQQHIWQATLGADAVCFTTHPAKYTGESPNYWTGSGWLPRVAQRENVAIVVYNAVDQPGLYVPETLDFTHAWLPRDQFDEVIERDGWVFAREGDGYLALRSQHPYQWQTAAGEDQNREMIVAGRQNMYICELGSRGKCGDFARFVERICGASLEFGELTVTYDSPSQGRLQFGWEGDFLRDGEKIELGGYPRYDN